MAYKLNDIAALYNRNVSTTCIHIKQLVEKGKFKKTSPGKQYSEREARKLSKLMDFDLNTKI